MDDQIYININLSNERFIFLFNNIEETHINHYIYRYNDILPYITSQEITLPTFVEQELMIPDDAVCGISFDTPNCRTSCDHHFCRAEITIWLKQKKREKSQMSCPTCRTVITQVFVDKNG